MKVTAVYPITSEVMETTKGTFIRYNSTNWKEIVDTPTGEIETDLFDHTRQTLEKLYQEYKRDPVL